MTMWQSHDQTKMNRITSVPDEFALETRLVVLNFMGLMPASCPPTALVDWPPDHSGHRHSLNGQYSLQDQSDDLMQSGTSQSNSLEASELGMKISEDQSSEPCTLIRKGTYVRLLTTGDLSSGSAGVLHSCSVVESRSSAANGAAGKTSANLLDLDLDAPSVSIIPASPPEAPENHSSWHGSADMSSSVSGYIGSHKVFIESLSGDATEKSVCESLNGNQSKRSSIVSFRLSPRHEGAFVDRQHSLQSCPSGSSQSLASMRQNSYVDVRHVDVQTLIRAQTLSPVAVSLKEEISKGIVDLEKSYAHATRTEKLPPPMVILSPESQVADMLRAIGDRVQDDYIVYLNDATDQLLQQQYDGQLTYSALQEAAVNLLHHSAAGWTQVALVLLMSQRLSLILLEQGDRSVGRLAEYTSRFITDHIADFILSRGGWQSISEIGVTETPLSVSQDILPKASSTDTALDPGGSVQASEALDAGTEDRCQQSGKISNNKDICLNGSKCCRLLTVSLPTDEDLTCPLIDGGGDKSLIDNNKDIYSDLRESICESETVDESSVLESFLLMESDEMKVGLICGVIAVTFLGAWIVFNRVKRG